MKIFTRIKFLLLSLFIVANVSNTLAQVTIAKPTGGENISVNKAVGGSAAGYTALGDITIADQAANEFKVGADRKIYLVPSTPNWQIEPGIGSVNFGGSNITGASILVEAAKITITYTVVGTAGSDNFITISGIRVQSTTTIPEAAATLRRSISAATGPNSGSITGFVNATPVATLSEVAGSFSQLQVLLPGETAAPGTLVGKTGSPIDRSAGTAFVATVNAVDAYWNRVNSSPTVAISSSDINAAIPANKTLPATGTTTFNVTLRSIGTANITATDVGAIVSPASSSTVNVVLGAFARMQILLPGETAAPGTASGKSTTPTAVTAGNPLTVRVRAVDAAWNLVSGVPSDMIRIVTNDVNATLPADLPMESDGEIEFTGVILKTAVTTNSRTITASNVTDPSKTSQITPTFAVSPGAYAKLLVRLPGETLAAGTATGKTGTPTSINAGTTVAAAVFAVDENWNRVAGNADLISITTNDGSATLPANAALPISGTRNFNVTLRTPGATIITAANTNISANVAAGTSTIDVIGGVFTKLQVLLPGETADPGSVTGKTGSPSPQIAGTPFIVKVRAVDGAWNVVNGITDVVRLTSTDVNAVMPSDLAMEADGEIEFSVTLVTRGNRTITASDFTDVSKTANTSASIAVAAGSYNKLLVILPGETLAPGTAIGKTGTPTAVDAGTTVVASVFAVDAYSNIVAGNADIITISTNDGNATLPANNTLAASGTRNFNVIVRSPGAITITATNTNGGISPGNATINVIGGVFTKLQVLLPGETANPGSATGKNGTPSPQVAGTPFIVRVRAVDGAWNVINGITDVVRLTSSDVNAIMPSDLAMEADGEITFSVTLITGGNRTITASDFTDVTKAANISANVAIGAGAFAKLQVLLPGETGAPGTGTGKTGSPSDRNSGAQFTLTVNAVDNYFNRVSISPSVAITSSDANATLPANKLLSATGTTTFALTLRSLGTATVTASDVAATVPAALSSSVNVVAGAFVKLQLLLPGETAAPGTATGKTGSPNTQIAGIPFNITVNAVDAGWNIITTVNDAVDFVATSDIYAELPIGATLTNGVLNTTATYRIGSATANRRLTATHATATSNQSPTFAVNIGPFSKLLILLPGETFTAGHPNGKIGPAANQGIGVAFNITVRATDAAFNPVSGATNLINITSSEVTATLPPDANLVNSTRTFSVKLNVGSNSNTLTAAAVPSGGISPYTTAGIVVLNPSAATDLFRSATTTGNWNNSTSWESFTGGVWQPSTLAPTTSSNGITVRNGNTINITTPISIDDVTIDNGGSIILTGGNLTVNNGAALIDFIVSGTLRANNNRTVTSNGVLQFTNGGRYQHAYTTLSGSIPTATWNAGSICEIVGYTSFAGDVLGSNQTFSDFIWNAPQTGVGSPSLLSGFTARNFTVTKTGGGTLNLSAIGGTTTITGNYTQTLGNVVANKTSGTQNLSFGGNFAVNGGSFALGNGTINITYNGGTQNLTNAGTAIPFQNVTFTNGGTKTLGSGSFTVATTGVLTMGANTLLAAGGNLTILSGASSSGTVAAIPSTSQITGNVNVQRFITGGDKSMFRTYRMLSSPVYDNGNAGSRSYNYFTQFFDDIIISGTGGVTNGFDAISSGPSAWVYDPNAAATNKYVPLTNINTSLAVGRGAYLYYRGDRSNFSGKVTAPYVDPESFAMDFQGILNQQNVTVPLIYSSTVTGFNLLGNPYASSIDWNSISASQKVDLADNVISIFNPALRQYATYDGSTSANGGSNIIPAGQGFFVKVKPGGGSFTFTEDNKLSSMPSFHLMATPVGQDNIALNSNGKVAFANMVSNTQSDAQTELRTWLSKENTLYKVETVVVFKDGKSENYIEKEDVPYLKGSEVFMSSLTNDDKKMVINYMPPVTAASKVKLDLDELNAAGNYALQLNYTNLPNGYLVKLTDKFLKTSSFVNNGDSYPFTIDKNVAATYGTDRFSVSFEAPTTLPVTYNSFNVAKVNEGVLVKWSTQTETNNNRFEVERAADDKAFVKLHTEFAKGSNSTYSYIDKNPLLGNNYYRLVQVDNDNKATANQPQVINYTGVLNGGDHAVNVFPNPVISKFTVKYNGTLKANQQTLKIVNATGQVLLTKVVNKAELMAGHEINIAAYTTGIYMIEVYESGNQRIGQMKLVKQ